MSDNNSGMVVGIVAIVAIIAVGWFAVQYINQQKNDVEKPVIDLNIGGNSSDRL